MFQSTIIDALKTPAFYGPQVTTVKTLQTHISTVFLTGTYAYKMKKPVNFGFLDFSTLDKRKYCLQEELRLNKRLAPDIYLEVLPITHYDNTLTLNGHDTIVEYVLKMKEFPQDTIMTAALKKNKVTHDTIDTLLKILNKFYSTQQPTEEITAFGSLESVKQNIDENFQQTRPLIDITIPRKTYENIQAACTTFCTKNKDVFTKRQTQGKILDCHGDLHSGNIVITPKKIHIFDCIEFNDRFRYCDVASDIGFLAMDLDYQNHPYLSSYLITQYIHHSNDTDILAVLNFYKSYRAFVRGKVQGFQLNDPHIDEPTRDGIVTTAQRYFALSHYYAGLFTLPLTKKHPVLLLISGLSGTGKSTIAQKLAVDYNATQINTDLIRKQRKGINPYERHHDEINTGLYDPKNTDATYDHVLKSAETQLKQGHNVVLDATFQKKKYRTLAQELATNTQATLQILSCVCPSATVKKRLESRVKKQSISDGRWEIYQAQKKTFEPYTTDEHALEINTGNDDYDYRMSFYTKLLTALTEAT